MERNRIMRQKKAELEEKASLYPHTGPLGSADQTCPIDVDELSNHLHMPNSALVSIFREDEIARYQKIRCRSRRVQAARTLSP